MYLRFDNNSYGGMLSEIFDGIVDTSVAGFVQSIPRYEIADFTQDLFGPDTALFIRRPSKRDLSFRYFWLGELSNAYQVLSDVCIYSIKR